MSPIREKFIKAIQELPYDIDEAALEKDAKTIIEDILFIYYKMYGIDDLSENDKECVESLIGLNPSDSNN